MWLAWRPGGRARAMAPIRVSKSLPAACPAAWRRALTSRAICTGASTTTVTDGKVRVRVWRMSASRWRRFWLSLQAQAFRPASWANSSAATPQRSGRQAGACQTACRARTPCRVRRLRWLLAKLCWAISQGPAAASSQRVAGGSRVTAWPSAASACWARAGSAQSRVPSGRAGKTGCGLSTSPSRGQLMTGLLASSPVSTQRGPCSSGLAACTARSTGLASAWAVGQSSGTMRVTLRPAASRACRAAPSQARLHTATHCGRPASGAGPSARCNWLGSSSGREEVGPFGAGARGAIGQVNDQGAHGRLWRPIVERRCEGSAAVAGAVRRGRSGWRRVGRHGIELTAFAPQGLNLHVGAAHQRALLYPGVAQAQPAQDLEIAAADAVLGLAELAGGVAHQRAGIADGLEGGAGALRDQALCGGHVQGAHTGIDHLGGRGVEVDRGALGQQGDIGTQAGQGAGAEAVGEQLVEPLGGQGRTGFLGFLGLQQVLLQRGELCLGQAQQVKQLAGGAVRRFAELLVVDQVLQTQAALLVGDGA